MKKRFIRGLSKPPPDKGSSESPPPHGLCDDCRFLSRVNIAPDRIGVCSNTSSPLFLQAVRPDDGCRHHEPGKDQQQEHDLPRPGLNPVIDVLRRNIERIRRLHVPEESPMRMDPPRPHHSSWSPGHCGGCRHWGASMVDDARGTCRCYASVKFATYTEAGDGCGGFSPRLGPSQVLPFRRGD